MNLKSASILVMILALSGCIVVPPEEPGEAEFVTVESQVLAGGIDEDDDEDRREGGASSSSGSSGGGGDDDFGGGDDPDSWE